MFLGGGGRGRIPDPGFLNKRVFGRLHDLPIIERRKTFLPPTPLNPLAGLSGNGILRLQKCAG
jgi:hypothetical protein